MVYQKNDSNIYLISIPNDKNCKILDIEKQFTDNNRTVYELTTSGDIINDSGYYSEDCIVGDTILTISIINKYNKYNRYKYDIIVEVVGI